VLLIAVCNLVLNVILAGLYWIPDSGPAWLFLALLSDIFSVSLFAFGIIRPYQHIFSVVAAFLSVMVVVVLILLWIGDIIMFALLIRVGGYSVYAIFVVASIGLSVYWIIWWFITKSIVEKVEINSETAKPVFKKSERNQYQTTNQLQAKRGDPIQPVYANQNEQEPGNYGKMKDIY